ncbi:MAG: hypothetical protein IT184_15935 [Acidobacteria bacterium]|nr:hypothetical protein [Acidobacteriota bacterium]
MATSLLVTFLRGAVAMSCIVAALLFFRFWRTTVDRLFLWFALAFVFLAASYTAQGTMPLATDWRVYVFGVRLAGFCLMLFGIYEKNVRR